MHDNNEPNFEKSRNKIFFGDNGEFEVEDIMEHISGDGTIEELDLFYKNNGQKYVISIEEGSDYLENDPEDEDAEKLEILPTIYTNFIDPAFVMNLLKLPSEKILEISVLIPEEEV